MEDKDCMRERGQERKKVSVEDRIYEREREREKERYSGRQRLL